MTPVTRCLPPVVLALALLGPRSAEAQETHAPAWEFGVHGTLLLNGYFNDATVNVSDDPAFAPAPTGPLPQHNLGGSIRQTRLVGTGDLAGFAGGSLHAELDVDFFGAQTTGATRSGPALRVRRVFGEMRWERLSLLVGQEAPLVAEVNPVSLAAVGVPADAGAGNLWLWIPQVRAGYDLNGGDGMRFGVDAAALVATTPEGQTTGLSSPNAGEASGRPMLEGRVRARWGDGGEVGLGAHVGWLSFGGDSLAKTNATVVTAILPLGKRAELRGEWYTGKGMAQLGGGGIAQASNSKGDPLKSTGGWAQLNLKASDRWELGGSYGYDDPEGTAADAGSVAFRDKNTQVGGRIQWHLAPVILAFEYRHFATQNGGVAPERTASHLNLAMGVEF